MTPAAEAKCKPQVPCYEAANIVNSISNEREALAPYSFATIWGTNLADREYWRTNTNYGELGGVHVLVNHFDAMVLYASPAQVNFVVPIQWAPGDVMVQLVRNSVAGPEVKLRLLDYAPTLFQFDEETAMAFDPLPQEPDKGWIGLTAESPGRRGGYAILYAAGLGDTLVGINDYEAPKKPVPIRARRQFQLLLDGVPVEDRYLEYVGIAPPYYGLYQINLKIPGNAGKDPEIRIVLAGRMSKAGLHLRMDPDLK